jgi:aminoglycoside phosphotransferase (APT) family kinase protein
VVHGDYRLDNVVLSPAGRVRVVLDWELYTWTTRWPPWSRPPPGPPS